jgi:small subunit ribosomal protein S1
VADFNVGDVIDGTVTKLVNFGAFVRVRDGLEGLIHISELSHQRVAHPGDVVHEGQQLKLKIISLDSERHRLGLSLKQAEEPSARPAPEVGAPTPPSTGGAPSAPGAPRAERRPRPERGFSMADAVQEPEGGIDNTLAAAFAQVREQVAASEEARAKASDDDDTPAAVREVEAPEAVAVAQPTLAVPEAEAPEAIAVAEPAVAEPAVAEPEAEAPAAVESVAAETETEAPAPTPKPRAKPSKASAATGAKAEAARKEPEAAAAVEPPAGDDKSTDEAPG